MSDPSVVSGSAVPTSAPSELARGAVARLPPPPTAPTSDACLPASALASLSDAVLQLLPVGVLVCDAAGRITFANPAARSLLEPAGAAPVVGRRLVVHASAGPDAAVPEFRPRSDDEVVHLERGDGTRVPVALRMAPVGEVDGRNRGIIVVAVPAGQATASARQRAVLTALADELANAADEPEIIRTSTRLVGEALRVQRCGFVENDARNAAIRVIGGYVRDPLPSLAGRHDLPLLGNAEWQHAIAASRVVIDDVTTHPHTAAFADYYRERGVRAYVAVPYLRDGRWVATLTVTQEEPRSWTEAELELLEHVVARTWPLIERTRAQEALQLMTRHAPVVLAYIDRELRVVFANHAFAGRFGHHPAEVVGKSVAEVLGADAARQLQPYFDRALAGEAVQFESEVNYDVLGRRFVTACYAPDRGPDGSVRGFLSAVTDITERKRAEEALAQSEERLRSLTQHAPVGIFQTNARGECSFVNERWCAMAGLSAEHAMGVGWVRAVHPDDRDRVAAEWQRCREAGSEYACEHRLLRADGTVVWVEVGAVGFRGSDGAVAGYIGTVMNITERKVAEFALRESEKRFRLMASRAPVGIFMADPDGQTVFVNANWCHLAGLTPQEAMGLGWVRALHPDDRARVLAGWDEAVQVGTSSHAEYRFVRPDGTISWVAGAAVQLRDASGRLTGYIGTVADFTERKQAELALRESEERFRMLADNIMQFAWICDANGRWLWLNRRYVEYTGMTVDDMNSGRALAAHHPDYVEPVLARFERHLRSGELWEDSFPLRGREGAYRWFLSRALPIRDEHGAITRWFGTNTDITDLRETQEMLRKAQADLLAHAGELERKVEERTASLREAIGQMEEFSYSVSHDLRSPLRAMHGYAEALIEDYGPVLDDTAREYLERIRRSSRRMETLTHDVLTYSRLARTEIALGPVELDAVVRDLIAQYAELQPTQVELQIDAPLGLVQGNELLLGQCLGNLLVNATKFVRAGERPRIRLHTEHRPEGVRVWVCDQGIGIPRDHQRGLFQMFQRAPTDTPYEGTGIGLAIVRKAVEKMGGTCGVESDGRSGSRFWIELAAARVG